MLGQFPVQSRALGTNSMTEVEGLKANDDFQFLCSNKRCLSTADRSMSQAGSHNENMLTLQESFRLLFVSLT